METKSDEQPEPQQWTCDTDIRSLPRHESWNAMFEQLFSDDKFASIQDHLTSDIAAHERIVPPPQQLFNAFIHTSLDQVRVVILGQDPYTGIERDIPQAMGLSFSVPRGHAIPSSLSNIFRNLTSHGHLISAPRSGNLESWAHQGCLLLNTSLTVIAKASKRNCHQRTWSWFTDRVIKYISDNCDGVVFVLWGADAFNKFKHVNKRKHKFVISSHPSGLSCNKPMKSFDAFVNIDQGTCINDAIASLHPDSTPIDFSI